ncbi:hypothetical protein K7432_000292 [Basidiobolus ranarum]|uniref:Uncharacterized protein n=1 Tax=Basidiobolus ranarum TaxID=34480 RepID=A0ABR2X4W9_9FUNG
MFLRILTLMLVMTGCILSKPRLGMRYDASPPPTCIDNDLGQNTTSEHNACDSIIETYPMYKPCCEQHRECYARCAPAGTKESCDKEFRFCLQQTCGAGKRKFVRSRCASGWSWYGPGMNSHNVASSSDFSCAEYKTIQSKSCPNIEEQAIESVKSGENVESAESDPTLD